jgi:hypothetical protein
MGIPREPVLHTRDDYAFRASRDGERGVLRTDPFAPSGIEPATGRHSALVRTTLVGVL